LVNTSLPEKKSDFELITMAIDGSQHAFTEIVRRHKQKIASTIHGMIGQCDEADDIGQEVFIRFFRNMTNFRGDSALGTYLTRIAINLSLNEIKRRKRKRLFSFNQMMEKGIDIAGISSNESYDENVGIVRLAIQKLDPKHRSVIVLRLIDGYTTEETAKILMLPIGTVLSRLSRAQIKLKEIIKPKEKEIVVPKKKSKKKNRLPKKKQLNSRKR